MGQDAGGLHAVIDALAADGHDATGVRVPTGSVKADGERASGLHVRGHAGLTTDSGVAAHTDNLTGHSLAGASGAVVRRVRVVRLSGDPASLGDVVVGMLGPATRATEIRAKREVVNKRKAKKSCERKVTNFTRRR